MNRMKYYDKDLRFLDIDKDRMIFDLTKDIVLYGIEKKDIFDRDSRVLYEVPIHAKDTKEDILNFLNHATLKGIDMKKKLKMFQDIRNAHPSSYQIFYNLYRKENGHYISLDTKENDFYLENGILTFALNKDKNIDHTEYEFF